MNGLPSLSGGFFRLFSPDIGEIGYIGAQFKILLARKSLNLLGWYGQMQQPIEGLVGYRSEPFRQKLGLYPACLIDLLAWIIEQAEMPPGNVVPLLEPGNEFVCLPGKMPPQICPRPSSPWLKIREP